MDETEAQSVLHRMAAAGRDAAPRSHAVLPARALANGLCRAAQAAMSLGVVCTECSERIGSLTELLETLPENGLLAVLDGPEEAQGLMALDNALLSSLIEMQMTGSLGNRPPPVRRVTRTDAALAADLIDATLREFEAPLLGRPEAGWAAGFGYASHVDDIRPLGMLLEDQDYRIFGLDLDLEEGARRGRAVLALPAVGRGAVDTAAEVAGRDPPRDPIWEAAMAAAVMPADVRLDAIMHRFRTPFAEVARLKVGDEIPLPAISIDRVRLVGLGGQTCAVGRLGQSRGVRALRINAIGDALAPPDRSGEALTRGAALSGPDVQGAGAAGGQDDPSFEAVSLAGGDKAATGKVPAPGLAAMPMAGDASPGDAVTAETVQEAGADPASVPLAPAASPPERPGLPEG